MAGREIRKFVREVFSPTYVTTLVLIVLGIAALKLAGF